MHPADQVEAFRRLADAGSTAAAIAARFGVSKRTVEKRLRLGNAAPVLLEAYRASEIDLETLMAFAVTTDQAHQTAVWETVSQQGWGMARSSFYAMTSGQHAEQPPAKRRGPKPAISDQALLVAIEEAKLSNRTATRVFVPDAAGDTSFVETRSIPNTAGQSFGWFIACLSALRIHPLGVDCVRRMASESILHVVCVGFGAWT